MRTRPFPLIQAWVAALAAMALIAGPLSACKPVSSSKEAQERPAPATGKSPDASDRAQARVETVQVPPFVRLAKELNPAVVNISTTRKVDGIKSPFQGGVPGGPDAPGGPGGPGGEDPLDDFFNRFFGNLPKELRKQSSLGSGFIVDKSGLVVTNCHVIEKADDIKVTMSDGKVYDATVKGCDQKTDVALIQIKSEATLPTVPLGDSGKLEIGEWVMAIGNPFGLTHTVTAGIVSAKGRVLNSGPYDDFIQTDASINPGNSGGPLFNIQGQVVGINTAIVAQGQGIGFAIPINLAKSVVEQLQKTGKVVRGWLGVSIQKLDPNLAKSFGLPDAHGALVADVLKDSPAARVGIQRGDVIVAFNGKPVSDFHDLPAIVAAVTPGRSVPIKYLRKGKETTVEVKVEELKEEAAAAKAEPEPKSDLVGLQVQAMTPELAKRFGMESTAGVVVAKVDPEGAAEAAGIAPGDIVLEIDRKTIKGKAEYDAAIKALKGKSSTLFLIRRGQQSLFVALDLK